MSIRFRRRFEILWESRLTEWPRDLAILLSRGPKAPDDGRAFEARAGRTRAMPVPGFVVSMLLHGFAFFVVTHLDFVSGYDPPRKTVASASTPIYIDMQALKILRDLPRVKPSGAGARPGAAIQPIRMPPLGSTQLHPRHTVVLNPMKPDNVRQTVVQKFTPPEFRVQSEQKVPDIVLVGDSKVAKPQVDLTFHRPSAAQNALDLPSAAAPTIPSTAPELPVKILATVQKPQLPVSFFSTSSPSASRGQSSSASSAADGGTNSSGDGVVVLSVDPGTFSQLAALAAGNRYAALSISPIGGTLGSPGGVSGGAAGGSSGTPGTGGDGSAAPGHGSSGGGGGGESQGSAILSISGGSAGTGGIDTHGLLHGSVRASAVYPVISPPKLRHLPVVVSTGSIGGGGLDLYGALPCGKVYTIFLPMPGTSWVLEYCVHQTDQVTPQQANNGVVRMEPGLVPPDADEKFDFRRLALPEKDAEKLIVLRGVINKDGSVSEVRVFQGLQPEMDAAAVLAFSKWKFKPAIRANSPITVDVLVGIPARISAKVNNESKGSTGTPN